LFKHKATKTTKRDLIVFVTPHIVRTTGKAAAQAEEHLSGEGVYQDAGPASGAGEGKAAPAPGSSSSPAPSAPAENPAPAH
jgi:type II secretory pathway component GspD/PulD (secretin)